MREAVKASALRELQGKFSERLLLRDGAGPRAMNWHLNERHRRRDDGPPAVNAITSCLVSTLLPLLFNGKMYRQPQKLSCGFDSFGTCVIPAKERMSEG